MMNRKNFLRSTLLVTSSAALLSLAATAQAETPSFNFVQFDYIVSGDASADLGGGTGTVDVNQGYGLQGAFEIGELAFVTGRSIDLNYDDKDGDIFGPSDSIVFTDMTFVGAGVHVPVADIAEIYGALGFARPTVAFYAGEGFGVEVGARANVGMAEVGLWYQTAKTSNKASGEDLDIDPSILGLDVAFNFSPDAPQLVLGYMDGKNTLKGDTGPDLDVDFKNFSIGVRKTF